MFIGAPEPLPLLTQFSHQESISCYVGEEFYQYHCNGHSIAMGFCVKWLTEQTSTLSIKDILDNRTKLFSYKAQHTQARKGQDVTHPSEASGNELHLSP